MQYNVMQVTWECIICHHSPQQDSHTAMYVASACAHLTVQVIESGFLLYHQYFG